MVATNAQGPGEEMYLVGGATYRLVITGKKYLSFIPHDLNYFHDFFIGEKIQPEWQPPSVQIDGLSKKSPDFAIWMRAAPVVSERVKDLLEPMANSCAQFLPFHSVKGKSYYVMNVTSVYGNIIDEKRSNISYFDEEKMHPMSLNQAVFRSDKPVELPSIFKVSLGVGKAFSDIFVTDEFARLAVENGFSGIALADPIVDTFDYALAGKSTNIVQGLVG